MHFTNMITTLTSVATLGIFCAASSFVRASPPVLAVIADNPGDVAAPYGDIISARITQPADGVFQLEMTLSGSPLVVETPELAASYQWFLDIDRDPSTGQQHVFVGSEYNILLYNRDRWWQGVILPAAGQGGGGTIPIFIDQSTNTILARVDSSAIGQTSEFDFEVNSWVIWEEAWVYDGAEEFGTARLGSLDGYTGVRDVLVGPRALALFQGIQWATFTARQRAGPLGEELYCRIPPADLRLFNLNARALEIEGDRVWARECGQGFVTAMVDGVLSRNALRIGSGLIEVEPRYAPLNPGQSAVFSLTGELWNGQPADFSARDIYWHIYHDPGVNLGPLNPDTGPLTTVTVTPDSGDGWAYLYVRLDTDWRGAGHGDGLVWVSQSAYDPADLRTYVGSRVGLVGPRECRCGWWDDPNEIFDLEAYFSEHPAIEILDALYAVATQNLGVDLWVGTRQWIAITDLPPGVLGVSGNPVRWDEEAVGANNPPNIGYGIVHEFAHNLLGWSAVGHLSIGTSLDHAYGEGLANIVTTSGIMEVAGRPAYFGLPDYVADLLDDGRFSETPTWVIAVAVPVARQWRDSGDPYETINGLVLEGMVMHFALKRGDHVERNFFLPLSYWPETPLPFPIESEQDRATIFASLLAYAGGRDIITILEDEWRFPIDHELASRLFNFYDSIVVLGDFDRDWDADLLDYASFQDCLTGVDGGPVPPECKTGDFDSDNDIDLLDWGAFQTVFTGSN